MGLHGEAIFLMWVGQTVLCGCFFSLFLDVAWYLESSVSQPHWNATQGESPDLSSSLFLTVVLADVLELWRLVSEDEATASTRVVPTHREHGAWPLHLVRIRWQWSHARLTLRLTGAEALRSSFGASGVELSIVGASFWRRGEAVERVERRFAITAEMLERSWDTWGAGEWAAGETIECRGTRSELRILGRMGRNQGWICGLNLPCVHEGFEKRDHVDDNIREARR